MVWIQPLLESVLGIQVWCTCEGVGMYKCGALCWVSMDMQLWCCSLAAVGSGSLDLDSGGLDIGPIQFM